MEIRSIPQPCAIFTRIGPLDAQESARSALERMIADATGHAPTKRERLLGLRAIIDAEVARLEARGRRIPQAPETSRHPTAQSPGTGEGAPPGRIKADGRAEHALVVKELGLKIPLLNNYAGMIEAVVEHEQTGRRDTIWTRPGERRGFPETAKTRKRARGRPSVTETELLHMPFVDLNRSPPCPASR